MQSLLRPSYLAAEENISNQSTKAAASCRFTRNRREAICKHCHGARFSLWGERRKRKTERRKTGTWSPFVARKSRTIFFLPFPFRLFWTLNNIRWLPFSFPCLASPYKHWILSQYTLSPLPAVAVVVLWCCSLAYLVSVVNQPLSGSSTEVQKKNKKKRKTLWALTK